MKKLILLLLFLPALAYAAPTTTYQFNVLPVSNDTYDLGSTTPSNEWKHLYAQTVCISGTCESAWPSGGSGVATTSLSATWPIDVTKTSASITYSWDSLALATSTTPTTGDVPYWTSTHTLGDVATSTLTASSPLTGSFTHIGTTGSLSCQTASGSQAGCLSSADWTTFNNKQAALTFSWPLVNSANTVSFDATTSPWSSNQFLYTNASGLFVTAASSSLDLPNTALQNSTISGIALGSNLNSLSNDGATLSGTSYNGSAAVSNWAINLAHANTWTGLQQFNNATSTLFTTTGQTWLGTGPSNVNIGSSIAGGNGLVLWGQDGPPTWHSVTLGVSSIGGSNKTLTLPNVTDTLTAGTGAANELTAWSGTNQVTGYSGYTLTSSLLSATQASSTLFSNFGTAYFGGTATTTIDSTGQITIPDKSTVASTSIATGSGNIFLVHSMGLVVASSTLAYDGSYAAAGTTTLVIANPLHVTTLKSFTCKTDVGTAYIVFGNGSATTTAVQCTSTPTLTAVSSSNTWNGGQNVFMSIGDEASTPNNFTVTTNVEDSN